MQNNKQELENKLNQINQDIAQKQNELDQKKSLFNELSSDKRKIIINPEEAVKKTSDKETEGDCDLLALDVDAIVNAANDTFHGGGGIDHVIGLNLNEGSKLYDEAREEAIAKIGESVTPPIPKGPYPSIKNAIGKGVLTKAYPKASFKNNYKNSPIKYVAHMVAPNISGHCENPSNDEKEKFYGSIRNAFELVKEKDDIKTIGFPAIGCGAFAWPFKELFENMFDAYADFVKENPNRDLKVYIAIFNPPYTENKNDKKNPELQTSKLATEYGYNLFEQKLKAFGDEIKNLENEIQKQEAAKKTIEDQIKNLGSKDANEKKLKALKENYNGQEVLEDDNIKKLINDLESKLEISEKDFDDALGNLKTQIKIEKNKTKLDKLLDGYKNDKQYEKILELENIKSLITDLESNLKLPEKNFDEALRNLATKIRIEENKARLNNLLAKYKNNKQYEKILELENIRKSIKHILDNNLATGPLFTIEWLSELEEELKLEKKKIDEAEAKAKISDEEINKLKNFWLAVYKVIYFYDKKEYEKVEKALNEKNFIRNNLDAFKSSVDDLKKEIVAKEKNIKDASGISDKDLEQTEKILSDTLKSRSLYDKLDAVAKSKLQCSVTIGGSAGFTAIFTALTIFLGAPVALPFIFGGVTGVSLFGNLVAHKIISKKIETMNKASKNLVENEKVKPVSGLIKTKDKTPEEIKNNSDTKTNLEI